MIRPKLSLQRPLAVLGAAFVGLTAAVAVAAPASAHHPEISGIGCKLEDGSVKVEWSVGNSETRWTAEIKKVSSPAGTPVTNIVEGAILAKKGGELLKGEQIVPAGKPLKLTVKAYWDKGNSGVSAEQTGYGKVTGKCKGAEPTPTPTQPQPTPTTEPTPTPTPTTEPTPTPTKPVPTPTKPVPTPSVPGEPTFELQENCDELVFLIINPKNGIDFTVTLTSEKGVVKELKGIPGQQTEVSFDAYPGLTVTPSIGDVKDEPVKWTEPKDCNDGGTLPVTGAAGTTIAGGAAVLLVAGVGLFFMARRRRIRFTA